MTVSMNLLQDPPARLLRHYLLPSVCATLVTSIYIIVDTIMLGRGVGQNAIVALNLVLPVFSMLFALGMLLGVGGGVLLSVANGAQDKRRATAAFSTALASAVALAMLVWLLGSVFSEPLCRLLGATNDNLTDVMKYCAYVVHFAPAFIFSTFFQAFVRNDRAPRRAMAAVLSGAVANIVLDYLFIFRMGMGLAGGALATVFGNALTVCVLLTHLRSPGCTLQFDRRSISLGMLRKILSCGAPSAFIEIASGIIIFAFNHQLRNYLGDISIAVYAIIANCAIVCMSLFNGVAQAAEPLIAANFGAAQRERILHLRKLGARTELLFGILLASTAFWMPDILLYLFVKPTPDILSMGHRALKLYFPAFALTGLNVFYSTYFQSIVQPARSLLLGVLRGIVFPLLLVLALPALLGGTAIWTVMPLTELATLCVSVFLLHRRIS